MSYICIHILYVYILITYKIYKEIHVSPQFVRRWTVLCYLASSVSSQPNSVQHGGETWHRFPRISLPVCFMLELANKRRSHDIWKVDRMGNLFFFCGCCDQARWPWRLLHDFLISIMTSRGVRLALLYYEFVLSCFKVCWWLHRPLYLLLFHSGRHAVLLRLFSSASFSYASAEIFQIVPKFFLHTPKLLFLHMFPLFP